MTCLLYVRCGWHCAAEDTWPHTALAKHLHVFLLVTADPQKISDAPRAAGACGRERCHRLGRDLGCHRRLRAPALAVPQANAELRHNSKRAPAGAVQRPGPRRTHRGRRGAAAPPGTAGTGGRGRGSPAAGRPGPASWRRPLSGGRRFASAEAGAAAAEPRWPRAAAVAGGRRWAVPRHPDVRGHRGAAADSPAPPAAPAPGPRSGVGLGPGSGSALAAAAAPGAPGRQLLRFTVRGGGVIHTGTRNKRTRVKFLSTGENTLENFLIGSQK